jgi:LacI family gluconate utilization system Gnt-I transcriptional repressor
VRTNRYEMGNTAASMLIEAIDGRRPEHPVLDLGFKVIERQSSSARRSDNRPAVSGGGVANKMVALPSGHD